MINYNHTTEVGSSRRRATKIIIENPAIPLEIVEGSLPPSPFITFVEEERIILKDNKEVFIPKGSFGLSINQEVLTTLYNDLDLNTGLVDEEKAMYGGQILQTVMRMIGNVYVVESQKKNKPLVEEEEVIESE